MRFFFFWKSLVSQKNLVLHQCQSRQPAGTEPLKVQGGHGRLTPQLSLYFYIYIYIYIYIGWVQVTPGVTLNNIIPINIF